MGKDSKRFQIDQNNLTPILRHSLQLELQHLRDLREREREYFRYSDNYLKNWKFEFRLAWCIGIWDTLNPKCITLLGLFKCIHQNKLYIWKKCCISELFLCYSGARIPDLWKLKTFEYLTTVGARKPNTILIRNVLKVRNWMFSFWTYDRLKTERKKLLLA